MAHGKSVSAWVRAPAVAGSFYPVSASAINEELDEFAALARANDAGVGRKAVFGAVCPHAGWRYAGALAWRTLARCVLPPTVLILAVNHRFRNPPPWSIWPEGLWQTPLGDVPVDGELASALMAELPELTASPDAHLQDHATEVLLPMLQRQVGAGLRIVPIVPFLARAQEGAVVDVGARIGALLRHWSRPVFVLASNDMTHFAPAAVAREQDRLAIDRMQAVDAAGLLTTARRERITMCGAQPVAAMLSAAKTLGATAGELVGYTHSGVVSGDDSDVVAYAGMVIE